MKDEILLSPTDFGRRLPRPVTGERVKQLIRSGAIKALKTEGGYHVIPESELRRFLAKQEVQVAFAKPAVA